MHVFTNEVTNSAIVIYLALLLELASFVAMLKVLVIVVSPDDVG